MRLRDRAFGMKVGCSIAAMSIAALAACGGGYKGSGYSSGIDYPDLDEVDLDGNIVSPEGNEKASLTLSQFKFAPETCTGIDLRMAQDDLDQEDLTRFFAAQNIELKPRRARDDLWWYEIEQRDDEGDDTLIRVRLAVLKNRYAASKDLHDSLLQHGPGWWGLKRGNLAVLLPKASLSQAVRFAIKYKLACWGMFTYGGVDDAYVVAGGYTEF